MTEGRLILVRHHDPAQEDKEEKEAQPNKGHEPKKARFDAATLDLQPSAHSLGLHHEQPPHHASGAPATQLRYGSSNEHITASTLGVYNSAPFKVKGPTDKAPTSPVDIVQHYQIEEEQTFPFGGLHAFYMQWRGQEPGPTASQFTKMLAEALMPLNLPQDAPRKDIIAALRALPSPWALQWVNKGKLTTKTLPSGDITSMAFMMTYAATERNPNDSTWSCVTRAIISKTCSDTHPHGVFEVGEGDPLAIAGTRGASRVNMPSAVSVRLLKLKENYTQRHLPLAARKAGALVCVEVKTAGPDNKDIDLGYLAVHPRAFKTNLGNHTEPAIFHARADNRAIWEPIFFQDDQDDYRTVALRLTDEWGADPEWGTPRAGQKRKSYFLTTPKPWQYGEECGNSDQISLHLAVAPSPGFSLTEETYSLETAFKFRMIPITS